MLLNLFRALNNQFLVPVKSVAAMRRYLAIYEGDNNDDPSIQILDTSYLNENRNGGGLGIPPAQGLLVLVTRCQRSLSRVE
jgi:hypothetical protein